MITFVALVSVAFSLILIVVGSDLFRTDKLMGVMILLASLFFWWGPMDKLLDLLGSLQQWGWVSIVLMLGGVSLFVFTRLPPDISSFRSSLKGGKIIGAMISVVGYLLLVGLTIAS